MGRRGPPPKPRKMKLLQGTFRKDRAPKDIPKPMAGVVKRPASLNAAEKRIWTSIAPWAELQGLLTKDTAAVFERWVYWTAQFEELRKVCRKHGLAISIQQGYRNQLVKASIEMGKAEAKFGLSPADRERIGVEPQQVPPAGGPAGAPPENPEDAIFGRKRRA